MDFFFHFYPTAHRYLYLLPNKFTNCSHFYALSHQLGLHSRKLVEICQAKTQTSPKFEKSIAKSKYIIFVNYFWIEIIVVVLITKCSAQFNYKSMYICLIKKKTFGILKIRTYFLKVTQINYVSRNQLHNTANGCQRACSTWLKLV